MKITLLQFLPRASLLALASAIAVSSLDAQDASASSAGIPGSASGAPDVSNPPSGGASSGASQAAGATPKKKHRKRKKKKKASAQSDAGGAASASGDVPQASPTTGNGR
jgi:hypothetical protein